MFDSQKREGETVVGMDSEGGSAAQRVWPALKSRPLLVFAVTIVLGIAGLLGGGLQPVQTTASATVLLQDPSADQSVGGTQTADTSRYVLQQQQIAIQLSTLANIATRLNKAGSGHWDTVTVASHLQVVLDTGRGSLTFEFKAPSASAAVKGADESADAFTEASAAAALSAARVEADRVSQALAALRASTPNAEDAGSIGPARTALLQRRASALLAEANPSAGVVQSSPALPAKAASRSIPIGLACIAGLLFGLALGAGIAYLLALRKPLLLDEAGGQQALHLPALGDMPLGQSQKALTPRVRRHAQFVSLVVAARASVHGPVTVIASPSPGVAREVAATLGLGAAQGRRVALVESSAARAATIRELAEQSSLSMGLVVLEKIPDAIARKEFDLILLAIDGFGQALPGVTVDSVVLALVDRTPLAVILGFADRLAYTGMVPDSWVRVFPSKKPRGLSGFRRLRRQTESAEPSAAFAAVDPVRPSVEAR
jgi:hypothetical protein